MSVTPISMENSEPTYEKDINFWDKIASKYADSKISDMKGYERTLSRTGDFLTTNTSVLELGCGTGTTALHLAQSCGQYLATDISSAMIGIANEKNLETPQDNLSFRVATARNLNGSSSEFDRVLGFNYLHLVPDLNQCLNSIHGHLKPGGLFISKTPCLGDMNLIIRLIIPVMRLLGKAPASILTFSESGLIKAIKTAGFTIDVIEHHKTDGKDTRPFIVARKR